MSLRQLGFWVRSLELLNSAVVDQPLLSKPVHGSAVRPGILKPCHGEIRSGWRW